MPTREDDQGVSALAGQSGSPSRHGPKTAAGKARVSNNALTHGISSTRLVVLGESDAEWEAHRRAILEALAPAGALELALAERVASALKGARQRLRENA